MGTYEGFARHLNETFQVGLGRASVEMTLVQASKGQPRDWEGLRKEPFSLLFKCAKPVVFPQRLLFVSEPRLRHDGYIHRADQRDKDGIVYQAVFN